MSRTVNFEQINLESLAKAVQRLYSPVVMTMYGHNALFYSPVIMTLWTHCILLFEIQIS